MTFIVHVHVVLVHVHVVLVHVHVILVHVHVVLVHVHVVHLTDTCRVYTHMEERMPYQSDTHQKGNLLFHYLHILLCHHLSLKRGEGGSSEEMTTHVRVCNKQKTSFH